MKKLILLLLIIITGSCDYYRDARNTTFNQTKASALLKKYEYFKDLANQIDVQRANLEVYKEIVKDDELGQEALSQRKSEYYGIIANYNDLVGKYNAAMAKTNYAFCNIGDDTPMTNLQPLPRNFKPYITK